MSIRSDPPDTSVNPHTRRIAVTAMLAVLASFLIAVIGAPAANAGPTMLAGSCYAGAFSASTRFVNYGDGANPVSYFTETFRTPSSYTCHDINVSGVTANGHTVATMLRVHDGYLNGYAYSWHWVASGWVVLASNFCRGCLYTIEAWIVSGSYGAVGLRVAA